MEKPRYIHGVNLHRKLPNKIKITLTNQNKLRKESLNNINNVSFNTSDEFVNYVSDKIN